MINFEIMKFIIPGIDERKMHNLPRNDVLLENETGLSGGKVPEESAEKNRRTRKHKSRRS